MHRHTLGALGAVLVLAVASAWRPFAQSAPPQVFRAAADHVAVEAVVTDGKDQPVPGLTKDDFTIVEGGRPQTISDFEFVSVPVAHRGLDPASTEIAPEPDVVTNLPSSRVSRQFVVVIDDLHLLAIDTLAVKRILTEFVNSLTTDDEVALVFIRRSDLSFDFTRDPGRLLSAIKNLRAATDLGEELPRGEILAKSAADQALEAARTTSFVLRNVASMLAGSSYVRRAIVYVGTYSILDPSVRPIYPEKGDAEMAQRYLDDAFTAARRADVPIYTLDPRGIPSPETSTLGPLVKRFQERASMAHRIIVQQDHLGEIAVNTGGRAFINRSNLTGAVDEIVSENGSFYLLGYYPDPFVRDGRFHEIHVHVNRSGLRVRARSGYVASSAAPTGTLKDNIETVLSSGLSANALHLTGFAAPIAASEKGMKTVVTVEVAYPAPADGSHRIDDDLELSAVALDPDGKVLTSSSREWHLGATVPDIDPVPFLTNDTLDLPSGALTLRVGVASKVLGKAGSVQLPLDVPKPSSGDLQMGGLVVGLAGDPREPSLGGDLLAGLVPFQPTTARVFRPTESLRVFVSFFCPLAEGTVRAVATIEGGGSSEQTRDLPVTSAGGNRGTATLDVTLPLAGLSVGEHAVQITATSSGGRRISRRVPLVIR